LCSIEHRARATEAGSETRRRPAANHRAAERLCPWGKNGHIPPSSLKNAYPLAKMRLFGWTIIAATAGAAEIHRDMLTDFEIPFNILA